MRSGAPCVGCNLHEENPAPEARIACRLSLPGGLNPLSSALAASAACEGFLWAVCFVWAVSCVRTAPPVRAEEGAGRASPLSSAPTAYAGRGGFYGSDTFYNEQALLWGVVHLAWAVTCVRRIPRRRRGRACGLSLPLLCAAIWRRSFLWEVGTSYNERRFL